MSGHLVEQSENSRAVVLRCVDCDWFAQVGREGYLDHETRIRVQPLVTLMRWSHIDPTLLANDAAGEMVERSMWRRVRDYLTRGVSP